jgi:hypothetical protein
VADIPWDRLIPRVTADHRGMFFHDAPEARQIIEAAGSGPDNSLLQRLREASETDRLPILLDLVRGQAAAVLGLATAEDIAADGSFLDLGMSSFAALELSNRLRPAGVELPPGTVFDHPTPTELALHLHAALQL